MRASWCPLGGHQKHLYKKAVKQLMKQKSKDEE